MPTLPATVIPARPAAINVYDPGFWLGFDVLRRLTPVVSSLVLHLKATLRFQTTFPDRINNSIYLFINSVEARLNGVMNQLFDFTYLLVAQSADLGLATCTKKKQTGSHARQFGGEIRHCALRKARNRCRPTQEIFDQDPV
jgi:hypothetical protein